MNFPKYIKPNAQRENQPGKIIGNTHFKKGSGALLNKFIIISLSALLIYLPGFSQDSTQSFPGQKSKSDSIFIPSKDSLNKNDGSNASRVWIVSTAHVATYATALIVLNDAWYKNYPKRGFTSFDDSKEWLQMDKIGHAWSAYNLSRISAQTWKWAGLTEKQSAIIGATSGFAFLTIIELLDAYSVHWGWSWSDIAANTVGSGLYLSQQLAWKEQRIQLKFSFHREYYGQQMLNDRADELFGKSWYERMLKDYNGQTYWLSANLKSFFKESKLPAWLNFAFGYGADGMYGGTENVGKDGLGNITFDRRDIPRVREFYLAPDIDLTKIKTKKKWLRTTLFLLNAIKIPAPTLMVNSKGQWRAYVFYF